MLIFINHDDMRSLECMEECIRRHYYVSDQLKDLKYADVIYLGAKGLDRKNRLFMNNETIMIDEETIKKVLITFYIENNKDFYLYLCFFCYFSNFCKCFFIIYS